MLLWLWRRLAATALIGPLAWEPPYASGTVLKRKEKKKKKEIKNSVNWSSSCGSVVMNPTIIHEDAGLIPGPTQWVRDPALLWLWHSPAAVALIGPPTQELPYVAGAALKRKKERKFFLCLWFCVIAIQYFG